MAKYEADNLVVLEGLEAVRLRPGMYIGTTGSKGMHHLLWEIVDNAIDEVSSGHADTINIIVNQDNSISIEDNGRGIPVDIHSKEKVSGAELVFTKLHAGGKFNNEEYKFSGGLHGVGASVVNALSAWLNVEVYKGGKQYYLEFHSPEEGGKVKSGIKKSELQITGKTKKNGTKVTFLPDVRVFGKELFDLKVICNRAKELAFLNKGLNINIEDNRLLDDEEIPQKFCYRYDGGVKDFVDYLNRSKDKDMQKIIYFEEKEDKFELFCAIQFTSETEGESIYSFVNNIPTPEGGTHETGLKTAFTKALNDYARRRNLLKAKDANIIGEDYRDGMSCVLAIRMQNVQFEGQTKTKLGNPEVKNIVENIVARALDSYLAENKNKDIGDYIVQKGLAACKIRLEQKKVRELHKQKNSLGGSVLIGKFGACSGKNANKNEIFIVEGDSAGGSAKQGRDRSFQAILPLRGKPINAEKKGAEKLLANNEIKTIIYALGADYGKEFNLENLKYKKVIILADADQDGAHIRCILLTFFYRYMKEMILNGNVYIGMPPLYKVETKDGIKYAYDDVQLDEIMQGIKGKSAIQRYKGLGEMNPSQLWSTTLDPRTRTLMRVTIEDAVQADLMIETLLGDNIEARKAFITENANFNKEDEFAKKYLER